MMGLLDPGLESLLTSLTAAATAVFAVLYILTRHRRNLSIVIFLGILSEIAFVTLHYTTGLNNIVILKDVACQVMTYALFLLWLSHMDKAHGFRIVPTPLNAAVFVFFLVSVVSACSAPAEFRYYAVEWASRFAACVLLFYLIVHFVNTRRRWNAMLHALIALMAITSLYGLLQSIGMDFITGWERNVFVSTFGSSDFFAAFLLFIAPVTLLMAVGAKTLPGRLTYAAIASPGIYCIWGPGNRSAWIALVIIVGGTILFECRFGRIRVWAGNRKRHLALAFTLAAALCLGIPYGLTSERRETLRNLARFDQGTNLIHAHMWWTGARMAWDRPVLGQGTGTSHAVYPFYRPDRYHRVGMSHNTDYVHSEGLQVLCEEGSIGFSAWLAMLVIFFYMCWRKLADTDDLTERYTLFGIACGLAAGLADGATTVNLRWTSGMLPMWCLLALGTRHIIGFDPPWKPRAADEGEEVFDAPEPFSGWTLFPLVAAAFAFMFWCEMRVVRGDRSLKRTEDTHGRTAIQHGLDTIRSNPYSHSAYYKTGFHYLSENQWRDALGIYNRLINIAPNYAQVHHNTGLIHYRVYSNSAKRAWLHQSVLEFEWAAALENNFENHHKMMQLYSLLLDNHARSSHHSRFIWWNVLEDSFMERLKHYRSLNEGHPDDPAKWPELYGLYIKPLDESSDVYWRYRMDSVRRPGHSPEEIRYVARQAVRHVPEISNALTPDEKRLMAGLAGP